MSDTRAVSAAPALRPLTKRDQWATTGLGLVTVAAVPFVVTGLFKLGLPALLVQVLCVVAGVALLAVPRRGRWLALAWFVGCILWSAALAVILWQFGQGMKSFD